MLYAKWIVLASLLLFSGCAWSVTAVTEVKQGPYAQRIEVTLK